MKLVALQLRLPLRLLLLHPRKVEPDLFEQTTKGTYSMPHRMGLCRTIKREIIKAL